MSDPGIEQPPLGVPDDPHTENPSSPPPGDPGLASDDGWHITNAP